MRKIHTALIAAGALALAGSVAYAASSDVHHMRVRLADGSVANIEYTGNVAPKVSLAAPQPLAFAAFPQFGPQLGFASFGGGFDQIAAQMDAQMRAMQQQMNAVDAMMAMPMKANAPIDTAFGKMAPGAHFCAQSVSITTGANGKQNIVRKMAGDCVGGANASATADHADQAHRGSTI
jgi:hypothetical protein